MIICLKIAFILLEIIRSVYSDLFDIRLAGGSTIYHGRLEIYYNGEWGTVCNDGWDEGEGAQVVCRQLGFGDPDSKISSGFNGNHSQRILLDEVECYGLEPTLSFCSYAPIGEHDCEHSEDVALVECREAAPYMPRLLDGVYSNSGQLKILYSDGWGQVCNNSWTAHNSQVACRELGYNRVDALAEGYYIPTGVGPYPFEFNCTGNETRLWSCDHTELDSSVVCDDQVKLQCSNDYDNEGKGNVRLVGSYNQGIVEAYVYGIWGTVCSHNWSQEESDVACKELGFHGAEQGLLDANIFDAIPDKHIHKFAIYCTGVEYRLSDCRFDTGDVAYGCSHNDDVALTCVDVTAEDEGLSSFSIVGIIIGVLLGFFWFYSCVCKGGNPQTPSVTTPQAPSVTTPPPSIPLEVQSNGNQGASAADLPPSYANVVSQPDAFKSPEETPPPSYMNYQFNFNTNNQVT